MSLCPHIVIDDRKGISLMNDNPVTFDTALSLPSVRIRRASQMINRDIHKYIPLRYLLVLLKKKAYS